MIVTVITDKFFDGKLDGLVSFVATYTPKQSGLGGSQTTTCCIDYLLQKYADVLWAEGESVSVLERAPI